MQSVILEVMLCSRSIRDIWFFDQVQGQDVRWDLELGFFLSQCFNIENSDFLGVNVSTLKISTLKISF